MNTKLESLEEVDNAIATIARLDVEAAKIQARVSERINKLENACKGVITPILEQRATLEGMVLEFANTNRAAFNGKKTLNFNFGFIKFTTPRPSIILTKAMEDIVAALKDLGKADIIKTQEYVEKSALKGLLDTEYGILCEDIGFCSKTPVEAPELTVDMAKIQLMPAKKVAAKVEVTMNE